MNFKESVQTVLTNRNLLAVTITQSLSMFAKFIWIPYWGLYILELDGNKSILGFLTTIQSLAILIAQLPGGVLSDRFGRKKVILAASLFEFLPPLIYRFSHHWTILIPGILASALSSLAVPALNALIADSLPKDKRATGFGAYTMAWYLAIVIVYPLGGYLMDSVGVLSGTRLGLLISFIVTIPILLIRWRFIEETVNTSITSVEYQKTSFITQLKQVPSEIWKLIIVAILSSFGFKLFWSFVVVYSVEVVGLSKLQWSYVSILANLSAALFMIPSGFLSDRIGRKRIIILSQLAVSTSSLGYLFLQGYNGIMITRLIGGIGEGLGGNVMGSAGGPVWQALVTEISPMETRGSILGLMGTLTGFITTPAPILGGYLYEFYSPTYTFLSSFIIGFIGCLIFALFVNESKHSYEI